MRRVLIVLVALVPSLSCAQSQTYPTGITTSLSDTALNTLVNSLLPSLVAKIGHITIPPISGSQDDFNYHVDNINCDNIAIGGASTKLTPPSTLSISMASISLSCTASWGFIFSPWPHVPKGSGTADLSISKTSAGTSVVFNTSNLRPTIFCPAASLNVGEVDITFHGDAVLDWLLSLFKSQLESSLRGTLDKTFGPVVASFINTDGNEALASIPITIPVPVRTPYNISQVRYGFTAAPVVTSSFLGLAIQGDVVPLGFTGIPPLPLPPPPTFDSNNSQSHMLVGHFTAYTLLSAAWTYLQANLLEWAIPSYDIPLGLNSTAGYGLIAPGMAAAFPTGGSVHLNISIGQVPAINITQQGIAAQSLIPIEFIVSPNGGGQAVQAFVVVADASFSLDIGVRPDPSQPGSLVFNGTLAYLSAHLSLGNSSVGDVSLLLLNGLVDLVLPFITSSVNGDLSNGFPLPAIPGVAFTNGTGISPQDGYVSFEGDFSFKP